MTPSRHQRLWVGTYPVAGQGSDTGRGEGVWRTDLDLDSGRLSEPRQVVETAAPSFLAAGDDGDVLYAVNESVDGAMTTFRVVADDLQPLAETRTGGAHPCHLAFDPTLRAVLIANYTSGSLSLVEVDRDGVPRGAGPDQLIPFVGSGPDPIRQTSAHAHFVLATPDLGAVLVADLGSDVIRRFRPDAGNRRLVEDGIAVTLPPGSGPRHAAFGPDGRHLYVVAELDGCVHTVAWDPRVAAGTVVASSPACPTSPAGTELSHLTVDGDRVLVGVRGADLLAEHQLAGDGEARFVGAHEVPGPWPRHHAVVETWTVVALQRGNRLAVLDRRGRLVDTAAVPSPACILADRGGARGGSLR